MLDKVYTITAIRDYRLYTATICNRKIIHIYCVCWRLPSRDLLQPSTAGATNQTEPRKTTGYVQSTKRAIIRSPPEASPRWHPNF